MSFVSTRTMIPLHRAAAVLGINPYHFSQIYTAQHQIHPSCDDDWYQYNWQRAGKISREALAMALRQAEDMLADYLHWTPIPLWHTEEVKLSKYYRTERISYYNAELMAKSLTTRWGFVTETGRKTSSYIDTPATVLSDEDGDGYDETVTITFATTVTTEDELRVYYPDKGGDEHFEIRPLSNISISAGTATITFPRYLIPLEELIILPSTDDDPHIFIDGDVASNFLDEVDVYRVYTDTSQQITYYYDPYANCSTVPCDQDTDTGCLFIRNSRLGILGYSRADYNEDTEAFESKTFSAPPQKALIYYRAGKQDDTVDYPNLQMNPMLERMIVYFSLSFLDTELCGCSNTKNIWQHQTRDLSVSTRDQQYVVPWGDLGNPFGTTYAAMRLWKYVQNLKLNRSPYPA